MLWNAFIPMVRRVLGKVIEEILEQLRKAVSPIAVTLVSFKSKADKPEHPENALSPISVIPLGKERVVKPRQ